MDAHGFLLLSTGDESIANATHLYTRLRNAGFSPFDGNGRPIFVILDTGASKAQWFQAGFWAGAGVPLIAMGRGRFRGRQKDAISRRGGWTIEVNTADEVVDAIARRELKPTEWDRQKNMEASFATKT